MDQRYETFSLRLINISRCVQRIKNEEMEKLGLKGTQVPCLFALFNAPDGLSLTKLSEACGEDKSMMSRTLKELSREGLIAQERIEHRYKIPYKLTEKGLEIATVVSNKITDMLSEGSFGISELERTQLYRLLQLIEYNLTKICKQYDTKN